MDPAIVSAMAAVFGSLAGGSATVATAWVTQRTLSKRELLGAEIRTRQTLYGEFIRECSKLVVDSFTHTDEIRALVRSGKADADPLRSFGEACRVELKSMRAGV